MLPIISLVYIMNTIYSLILYNCTIGSVLPVNSYKTLVLIIPVLLQVYTNNNLDVPLCLFIFMQIVGIFWDILVMHQSQAAILRETQDERRYFQSASEQLQALNNISEVAITTKSAFLSGLANEMKSIVHGSTYFHYFLKSTLYLFLSSEYGHEHAE